MPQLVADRNLLFGILALQMDFITREQLLAAMQAWVFDKSKTLGDILCTQKALDADHQSLLDQLVQKHLAKHDNNTEKSLAALAAPANLRADLQQIADTDVHTSLCNMPYDPYATVMPTHTSPGQSPTAKPGDPYTSVAPTPSMIEPVKGGLRFRIVRPHARGGLGEVFVALDEELHREVALKEIQERAADNQDSRARFMLEAEITGGLEHPGIVPVYGLGTYPDGRPYYAMRFIRGDSLKDAIERYHKNYSTMSASQRSLELRGLLGRLVDVCNAIAYAHSRDVLHRDLKPGNIMLGKYGETLVVDWGLAKPLGVTHSKEEKKPTAIEPGEGSLVPNSITAGSATLVGSAIGTPQYMSPEQAAGRLDQLGPATDVYSLGATLYCILTGVPPVSGDVGDMLRRVQRGDYQKPSQVVSGIPPALEAICLKAMALQPANRYAAPHGLADDIEHWLADEPVTAFPEPWTVRTRRWVNRNMTKVASVASAVVVALVGLIVTTILLTAANERERLAKEQAVENFKLAKQAVDDYHTNVSEDVLLHEPGMQPLRKKLLGSARDYYSKFVADRGNDPGLKGESARAMFRLAQITADIGSKPEAIDLHKKAAAVFESLKAEKGKDDFQADLAATYHHLGRIYRLIDKLPESDEYYGKAKKLWEQLAAANPKEAKIQAGLARTYMGIGNANQNASRKAEALDAYEKSLKAWDELARTNAALTEYQREIAVNHANLGALYQNQTGKKADAEKSLRAAWTIQKKLADDAPNVGKYQDDLGRTSYLLAKSLADSPDTRAEARQQYQTAADRWSKLVDLHPAVFEYQTRLADTYLELAQMQFALQDITAAEATCAKGVEVHRKLAEKNKDEDKYQGNLANSLSTLAEIYGANTLEDHSREAEAAFNDAIAIQEKRAADKTSPYRLRDLAQTYNRLGAYQMSRGREEKATATFKKAVPHWETLTKLDKNSDEFAIGLSQTYFNLGNVLRVAGKQKDADPWFTNAIECVDVKNAGLLANPGVQFCMSKAYWMRAEGRTKLKDFDHALKDWDHALEYAKGDDRFAIRLPRAAALARAGNHAEAAKEANALLGKAASGDTLFRFARVYALSATAAKDQKSLADTYAAQAFKVLSSCFEKGYFKSGINLSKLQDDPDFQVLRDRPEFKKILSEHKLQ